MTSDTHQRQMILFQENPNQIIDGYSREFKDEFLSLLKHRFLDNRVYTNMVYNDYIAERNHIHMNATVWSTLTDFVKYLGKEGLCKVDETEKGWYIAYIDRDPETPARQAASRKKDKMNITDE